MQVYPSILTPDFKELKTKVNLVKDLVDIVHIDIMDGIFVSNKTIYDIEEIKNFAWPVLYELHLMVRESEVKKWLNTGAKRIIFHMENYSELRITNYELQIWETIKKIKGSDKEVGIAVNPDTEIENVFPFLKELDLVLVMSVNPGFSGQKFMPKVLHKLKKLHQQKFKGIIEIDGGVQEQNIKDIKVAGANAVSAASAIWDADKAKIKDQIKRLK